MEVTSPLTYWDKSKDREKDRRTLDPTCEVCAYTGLPTIKAEKSLYDGDCPLTAILNPNGVNTLALLTV